ncbi:hypothetical protein ACIQZG_02365 [Lysinibacillus sp. NPDC096418]|uniref:hypothetical protein n=1 Tax=Lysinibacillus sp. NPDC096418 TaxID=3364138 RepID=UPI00381880E8
MSDKHLLNIYFERLEKIEDPSALVVTTHAFCEHIINEILAERKKTKTKNKYINNSSSYIVKLDLCYNMNLLDDELFDNLMRLNTLRNKCAHGVNVDFEKIDHNYNLVDKIFNVEKETDIKNKVINISANTLLLLNNHAIEMGVNLKI